MTIRTDEYGEIDISAVNEATSEEVSRWIEDRLNGRDPIAPGGGPTDEGRGLLLEATYDCLEPSAAGRFREVIVRLLTEMTAGRIKNWSDDARELLLQMAEPVLSNSPNQKDAVRLALMLADRSGSQSIRRRALQLLAGIGERLDPAFWVSKFQDAHDYPMVLEGLGNFSVESALKFFSQHPSDDSARDALEFLLPIWIEQYGNQRTTDAVRNALEQLQPSCVDWLIGAARAEGLPVSSAPPEALFPPRARRFGKFAIPWRRTADVR